MLTCSQGNHPPIPGKCWAFPGSQGNLFIELSHTVIVSHVTLDHVLTSALPTDAILSAPRDFSVYVSIRCTCRCTKCFHDSCCRTQFYSWLFFLSQGLQSLEGEAILLGTFTFDLGGDPTQTFAVKVSGTSARIFFFCYRFFPTNPN